MASKLFRSFLLTTWVLCLSITSAPARESGAEQSMPVEVDAGPAFLVKDINTRKLNFSSMPKELVTVGSVVYFFADDGRNGDELWKSDGTNAGTVMVKDINPGVDSSVEFFSNLTNVNGTLFFTADDGSHGYELWKRAPRPVPSWSRTSTLE